jgi:hypothetical protein
MSTNSADGTAKQGAIVAPSSSLGPAGGLRDRLLTGRHGVLVKPWLLPAWLRDGAATVIDSVQKSPYCHGESRTAFRDGIQALGSLASAPFPRTMPPLWVETFPVCRPVSCIPGLVITTTEQTVDKTQNNIEVEKA